MRFLFVDRIIESQPGKLIRGIKHVTAEDFFLTKDASGRACFISSLVGETLGQLAAWNVMQYNGFSHRPVAGIVANASIHRHAYVGDTLLLESHICALDEQAVEYHSIAKIGHDTVFTVEGALGPLLPMNDFIEPELVKNQFSQIYRPGNWTDFCAHQLNHENIILASSPTVRCNGMHFDRICSVVMGKELVAEKDISMSAPYFNDHFPRKPVLPMTVLLECILNLVQEFMSRSFSAMSFQVNSLRKIKMNEFINPGDVVRCCLRVKHESAEEIVFSCRSEVAGKRVCVVEIVLIPKGKST